MKRRFLSILLALMLFPIAMHCQMRPGQVDIYMGVDFNYRDILFNGRVFDVLLNLTPSVK